MDCDCKTVGQHFRECRGVDYSEVSRAWETLLNLGTSKVNKDDIKHLKRYKDYVQEAIEMKVGSNG